MSFRNNSLCSLHVGVFDSIQDVESSVLHVRLGQTTSFESRRKTNRPFKGTARGDVFIASRVSDDNSCTVSQASRRKLTGRFPIQTLACSSPLSNKRRFVNNLRTFGYRADDILAMTLPYYLERHKGSLDGANDHVK
jgi:hypothetical protein